MIAPAGIRNQDPEHSRQELTLIQTRLRRRLEKIYCITVLDGNNYISIIYTWTKLQENTS